MSFQCHICAKEYTNYHVAHHSDAKPFQCGFFGCSNAYKTKADLKQHQKSHEKQLEMKFPCKDCKQVFKSSKDLFVHRRDEHNKKRMSWCGICKRNIKELDRHRKEIHERNFGFACDICGITFSLKKNLRCHIQNTHLKLGSFRCEKCDTNFPRMNSYRRHLKSSKHKEREQKLRAEKKISNQHSISRDRNLPKPLSSDEDSFSFNGNFEAFDDSDDSNHVQLPEAQTERKQEANREDSKLLQTKRSPMKVTEQEEITVRNPFEDESFEENDQETEKPETEEGIPETNPNQSHITLEVRRIKCLLCSELSRSDEEFVKHFVLLHLESNSNQNHIKSLWHCCDRCGETFAFVQTLKAHMSKKHASENVPSGRMKRPQSKAKERLMKCEQCGDEVGGKRDLCSHVWNKHFNMKKVNSKYFCLLCEETLTNSSGAKRHHADVHKNGENPMRTCHECSIDFRLHIDFKRHCEIRHSHAHMCLVCGVVCRSMIALKHHRAAHRSVPETEKRLTCDLCNHRAQQKKSLVDHMVRKHGADRKKYSATCEYCGETFKTYWAYRTHMMSHERERQ